MKAAGRVVSANEAMKLTVDYVCGRCWQHLNSQYLGNNQSFVYCSNEDCNGDYFHSKKGVERARQEDILNAAEARYNLRDVLPNPHKGKSEDELLKELGF